MINQLYEAKLLAEWLVNFELQLTDIDDYNGPAMVNKLDGSYIYVLDNSWMVHIGTDEVQFKDYLRAAIYLWEKHSRDCVLNNG